MGITGKLMERVCFEFILVQAARLCLLFKTFTGL